jgi:hypothetical protein
MQLGYGDMKQKLITSHNLSLFGGMSIGLLLGDFVWPEIEATLGDVLGDLVFAAGGAAIASLIHDSIVGKRDRQ